MHAPTNESETLTLAGETPNLDRVLGGQRSVKNFVLQWTFF
jgi:hypothetical protein